VLLVLRWLVSSALVYVVEYEFPFATSGLSAQGLVGPSALGRRRFRLRAEGEDEHRAGVVELHFDRVQAYRVTFSPDVQPSAIERSYGRVTRLLDSAWASTSRSDVPVHHYEIYVDDGPCVELLAGAFVGRFFEETTETDRETDRR